MTSPTQRTLSYLRDEGYIADVVERWIMTGKKSGIRRDLFGFADIIAIRPNEILAVQCCAGASHGARRAKLEDNEYVTAWREAGGRVAIISWYKYKEPVDRKFWRPRIEYIGENENANT